MRLHASRRMSALGEGLPLVSLIDVVFLLLIYFLLTSRLSEPESKLAAALQTQPKSGSGARDLVRQVVTVELDAGRVVYRVGDRRAADLAGLTGVLRTLPKDQGVIVRVSGAVTVDAIAVALQAARDAEFRRISYVPAR